MRPEAQLEGSRRPAEGMGLAQVGSGVGKQLECVSMGMERESTKEGMWGGEGAGRRGEWAAAPRDWM